MDYLLVKQVHVTCAVISYLGFFARGVGMMRDAAWMGAKWVRIVPHVVDTLLLASALALAFMSRQYPLAQPWLTAKVIALAAYIVVGVFALRRGRTRALRVGAWIAAQAVFFYIVAVALTRSVVPWIR
jgi:uncharacterized membrane protein SirB2